MNTEKLKQTIMLKKALTEEGVDPKKCKIEIDHDTGHSYVNDLVILNLQRNAILQTKNLCSILMAMQEKEILVKN